MSADPSGRATSVARRILVLSDLHITPAERYSNFTAGRQLVSWTEQQLKVAGPDTILVLAGDVIDFLLLEERPGRLDLSNLKSFVERTLQRLFRHGWAESWRQQLRAWLARGSRIVLLPGNHDPEWLHPDTSAILNGFLSSPEAGESLTVWRESGPWQARCGSWEVVIGHGHRADPINDIDPAVVHQALASGAAGVPLPPGSEFVLGPLATFKRAMNPRTGQRRFPFLDAVKPETRSVLLLLLYLDPKLVRDTLPASFRHLVRMLRVSLTGSLRRGPTLDASNADGQPADPLEILADQLAGDVVKTLTDSDRQAPNAVETAFFEHLRSDHCFEQERQGGSPVLGPHDGPFRALLRAWLRSEASNGAAFFDVNELGAGDHRIVDEWKQKIRGPLVIVAGHTHAARRVELGDRQVYLNTGTWTDLLDLELFVDNGDGIVGLIDAIRDNSLKTTRRLNWAEIDASGRSVREFSAASAGTEASVEST